MLMDVGMFLEYKFEAMRKLFVIVFATAVASLMTGLVWSADALTLTALTNNQQWQTGMSYTIKWDKGNAGSYVKIQLLKSGKLYKTIRAKTNNDGKYRWKIPSSVKSGNEYQIKIASTTDKTVSDTSDKTFRITKKPSTIKKSKSNNLLQDKYSSKNHFVEIFPRSRICQLLPYYSWAKPKLSIRIIDQSISFFSRQLYIEQLY